MLHRISKFSAILAASLILSACSSATGPAFYNAPHLDAGDTGVYVYRTKHAFAGKGLDAKIFVDDQPLGTLKDGGFLYKRLTPGTHTISAVTSGGLLSHNIITKNIHLDHGQKKYIRVEWETDYQTMTFSGGLMLPAHEWTLYQDAPYNGQATLSHLKAS